MDAVEEIKARLAIEDVIGEYIPLKRAGRNWRGSSPFTNEKTPSFMVSPEKQIWHDFSSGKGGNIFSFVMEVEGLDFKEALELLARKAGVELEQYKSSGLRGQNKERLYELLQAATKFYQVQFSKNQTALKYVFNTRGYTKETVLEWGIGYSPNTGDALIKYAKSKGFTESELKQTGLIAQNYRGGLQDMFRGRLMIPLQDPQGRVIGFTARILEEDPSAPKYINTPQTVLYDKSRHIYGLHLAKESIRKDLFVVLVEGNLDVIASHQSGVKQVVATAGTAMTEFQLKALSRLTGDIRICFDADKAGLAATERAIPIASKIKVSLSIIDIPSGKDPDELIKQNPDLWAEAISNKQYALDWLIKRYQKVLDITAAQGKRQFSDILMPVVNALVDPVERDHYLNSIAKIIDVSKDALTQKMDKTESQNSRTIKRRIKIEPIKVDKSKLENQKQQDQFLCLMLLRPTLREFLSIVTSEMLFSDSARELLDFLKNNLDFNGKPEQVKGMQKISDYVKILSLLYEELYQGLELNELHYEAARLQARLVEQFIKTKKIQISNQLSSGAGEDEHKLLTQAKDYDQLLKKLQESTNADFQV